MPKKKLRYPERPWTPDRAKWAKLLDQKQSSGKSGELAPKGGWLLYRLDTLEDVDQTENIDHGNTHTRPPPS